MEHLKSWDEISTAESEMVVSQRKSFLNSQGERDVQMRSDRLRRRPTGKKSKGKACEEREMENASLVGSRQ
jgi:hypothetical protein